MQPGETVTPGEPTASAPDPEKQDAPSAAPEPTTEQPVASVPAEPATNWQFSAGEAPGAPTQTYQESLNPVSWTASEYIAHNKGAAWFAGLGAALLVFIIIVFIISRDVLTSVMLAVAGITFGVFAARQPRTLQYTIDSHGIKIGEKSYPYNEFKSFDITEDGQLPAILLMPLKRFLPPITVFYDQNEEEAILGALSNYLPHQEHQPDAVDRLMRRIRF